MTRKSNRVDLFLNSMTIGSGAYLGISIISFLQSLFGLIIGYFIVMRARKMKKDNPKSQTAKLLEVIGILIMFGPFAAYMTFSESE